MTLMFTTMSSAQLAIFAGDIQLRKIDGTSQTIEFGKLEEALSARSHQIKEQPVPLVELKSILFDRKLKMNTEQQTVVQLTNSDLFVVESVSIPEDTAIVKFGDNTLMIPVELVRNIFFETTIFQLKDRVDEAQGDDVVVLKNGDVVRGQLGALEKSEVEVLTKLGKLSFPQSQFQSMTFDAELASEVPVSDDFVQFFLLNGSAVSASQWHYNSTLKQFDIKLFSANHLKVRLEDLSRIEFWNSNTLQLSRLSPIRHTGEGYFGTSHSFETNRTLLRQTLVCNQSVYTSGFAVRSRSNLAFQVPKNAVSFHVSLGFNKRTQQLGDVNATVLVNDKVVWEDSISRKLRDFVHVPLIPVDPQQKLELEIDFGKQADIGDDVIWCQPYFLLQK